jgi:hypothetical protein
MNWKSFRCQHVLSDLENRLVKTARLEPPLLPHEGPKSKSTTKLRALTSNVILPSAQVMSDMQYVAVDGNMVWDAGREEPR